MLPVWRDALEAKRGKFPLGLVGEGKIKDGGFVGLAMAQDGLGLARVVVAIVIEEDDFAADLLLEAAGGLDLGDEEAFREKSAGLLAKTNDRCGAHIGSGWVLALSPRII